MDRIDLHTHSTACLLYTSAATGKEVLDGYCEVVGGEGIKSAQATSQKDSYGNCLLYTSWANRHWIS